MPATIDAAVRAKQIVESLGGRWSGSRGECRCPAHDDHSPSLSVRLGTKAILFKCFAGCTSTDILKALDRQGLLEGVRDRAPSAAALKSALLHASVCAAINISRRGCQPPTWDEAEEWVGRR